MTLHYDASDQQVASHPPFMLLPYLKALFVSGHVVIVYFSIMLLVCCKTTLSFARPTWLSTYNCCVRGNCEWLSTSALAVSGLGGTALSGLILPGAALLCRQCGNFQVSAECGGSQVRVCGDTRGLEFDL